MKNYNTHCRSGEIIQHNRERKLKIRWWRDVLKGLNQTQEKIHENYNVIVICN